MAGIQRGNSGKPQKNLQAYERKRSDSSAKALQSPSYTAKKQTKGREAKAILGDRYDEGHDITIRMDVPGSSA